MRGPVMIGRSRESGSMSVELAILSPVFVMFLLLLIAVGRIVDVKSQIEGAARDGARAASVARSQDQGEILAREAALESLGGNFCAATPNDGNVDVEGVWEPGGHVTVTVRCTVDLTRLNLINVNVNQEYTGLATAPIDTYRRFGDAAAP